MKRRVIDRGAIRGDMGTGEPVPPREGIKHPEVSLPALSGFLDAETFVSLSIRVQSGMALNRPLPSITSCVPFLTPSLLSILFPLAYSTRP